MFKVDHEPLSQHSSKLIEEFTPFILFQASTNAVTSYTYQLSSDKDWRLTR